MNANDVIEEYLLEMRLNGSDLTVRNYRSCLMAAKYWFEDQGEELIKAQKNTILAYANHLLFVLDKPLMVSTVSTKLNILRSFYSHCVESGHIEKNPCQKSIKLKEETRAPVYLTIQESYTLIDSVKNRRDRLIITIFLLTGVRVSELLNIKVEDIDLESGTVKVFGKGRKERYVIIDRPLCKDITNYIKKSESSAGDRLFNLTPRTLQYMIKKYGQSCGFSKNLTPHKLRHTFATLFIQSGGNVILLQKLLGHSSTAITERYTHYNVETSRQEIYSKFPLMRE